MNWPFPFSVWPLSDQCSNLWFQPSILDSWVLKDSYRFWEVWLGCITWSYRKGDITRFMTSSTIQLMQCILVFLVQCNQRCIFRTQPWYRINIFFGICVFVTSCICISTVFMSFIDSNTFYFRWFNTTLSK